MLQGKQFPPPQAPTMMYCPDTGQKQQGNKTWIEISKTISQNKSFFAVYYLEYFVTVPEN
jgi:hypothetical protein